METGRENVKNNGVTDGVMDCEFIEYYSHTLANTVDQTNRIEWVLVTRSRNFKKFGQPTKMKTDVN